MKIHFVFLELFWHTARLMGRAISEGSWQACECAKNRSA